MSISKEKIKCFAGIFQRLRYFDGLMLKKEDFEAEQHYFREKAKLLHIADDMLKRSLNTGFSGVSISVGNTRRYDHDVFAYCVERPTQGAR